MRWTLLVLALSMVGCGGSAAHSATAADLPHARFEDLDRDRNQALDAAEFAQVASALYAHLDDDRDGAVANDEMTRGLFGVWDVDRSGRIDAPELARAEVAWFPEDGDAELAVWDTNASGDLDRDEHAAGLERTRLVQAYDENGDGRVSDQELAQVLFSTWDVDGDDAIDALEWRFDG